ncbi:MAG TPA: diacylglycerol kinase family protein [Pyrinomonadaceae bacterium]|nr:diacylglycerol kinase family protein [Pyrinomonadaceae bacterium]
MLLPLVIVNPASGGNSTRGSWPAIAADLATHFGAFNCAFTEGPGGGRVLGARGAEEGRSLIIACGGDGTISEVANGILESGRDVELGILPSGTGGDFRRTLDIPARSADAARLLRRGRARRIDVGRVTYLNDEGAEETRHLLGVASVGMSTDIINRVKEDNSRWLPTAGAGRLKSKLSFALAGARTTMSLPQTNVVVSLDEGPSRRLTVANFCVANARYFGGGMKVAPEALLDDGRFDVISIGDLSALKILANAHKLYRGTHLDMDEVHATRARVVTVKPARKNQEVAIEIDGELPGRLPARFEILPKALRVRCSASV